MTVHLDPRIWLVQITLIQSVENILTGLMHFCKYVCLDVGKFVQINVRLLKWCNVYGV